MEIQLPLENFLELLLINSPVFVFVKHLEQILSLGKVAGLSIYLSVGRVKKLLNLFGV